MRPMLFYEGCRQFGSSQNTIDNINPATGETINSIPISSREDIEKAVQSARKGFQEWSNTPPSQRGRILRKAAHLLRERNEELAKIEVEDCGKPIAESLTDDVTSGADALEYYGGLAAGLHGTHHDLGKSFAYTRREPLGICAGIGAWNYPIQIACWKSAPALACGNSMIFKPAELTPRTAVLVAEIFTEAGLPDGVFNIVQGDRTVGQMLTRHQEIRKVSLTGEVATGKKVMADASKTLKHVTLELGGKSPLLIFKDADLEEAVNAAMLANFYTQGEICSNGTRVYLQEEIKEPFLEKLIAKTRRLKIGNPMDKNTQVGALISREHLDKVLHYIDLGKKNDALLFGGNQWISEEEDLKGGYFVEPTIFEAASDSSCLMQEEIFGPVMTVATFKTEEEAVRRANQTPYGLAAGVFTQDLRRGHRVVHALQAGMCWINHYNLTPVEVPFGPYKESGFGRENGFAGIEAYSQLKTVYVEMNKIDSPY